MARQIRSAAADLLCGMRRRRPARSSRLCHAPTRRQHDPTSRSPLDPPSGVVPHSRARRGSSRGEPPVSRMGSAAYVERSVCGAGVGIAFGLSAEAVPKREHPSEHAQTGTLAPAVGSTVARRGARSLPGVTHRGQRQVNAPEHEHDAPHRPSVPRALPSARTYGSCSGSYLIDS